MGENEEATLRTLRSYRKLIDSLIEQHHGRFVNSAGDSVLAEFASVVNAVQCAVEIQSTLKAENALLPPERRMEFRIGVNLGDVMIDGEQIYGDGVNVAARLESLAEPGGICISGKVHDEIRSKLALGYQDLGAQQVKNITEPVRVLRVMLDGGVATHTAAKATERTLRKHWRGGAMSLAGLALIAAVVVFVQHLSLRPPATTASIPPVQAPVLTLPDKPSIVVLPFTNMSGDREQEYFSDGITDDLITALSRVPGLFVIARTSAFTYKGKAAKAQDIGRELGVAYLLEGSVRKSDNELRITAQLVDTTGGNHLWAERYDRPLKDIFALQDEIVQKIVTTLKLQLRLEQQGWVARKHTDNLEAYDYYLRGLEYASSYSKEGNAQARQMWQKAVALDPDYAEAYAQLGRTYGLEWIYRWNADPQTLKREFELERKALALDDSLPIAHSRLGQTYAYQQQYDQAVAEGERAIALDPNNADSYFVQANVLNNALRSEEALRALAQGMRVNPRYSPIYLEESGKAYLQLARYSEAITTLKEATRRSPTSANVHDQLALSYVFQWLSQESPAAQTLQPALTAAQRALDLNDSYVSRVVLGDVYLYQQQYDQSLAEMQRAVAVAPNEAFSYASLAMVLSYVGRSQDALQAAAQARRLESRSMFPFGY